ncbi:MAG: TIGR03936 family radical SAM-associated protein [Oscillospiraceae bacterium]|nr:TIGR03936 family radical SAM-associated protein [Oscillospiraceae bacterium]
MNEKLRLRFSKTGRAVWISHLDLMQTMQRAFSRAGLALKYSEGYNPHPQISIALPLSVGAASRCELMDFRLREDAELSTLPERLTAALPEGIEVLAAYEAERKCAEIKWLELEGRFEYDGREPAALLEPLRVFFARESIIITRKTKRGVGESDIRPAIRSIDFTAGEGLVALHAFVSAQEPTLNPEQLAEALRQLAPELAPDFAAFTRLEIYDKDMIVFR